MAVRSAIRNERTTVVALSATTDIIKQQIGTDWQEISIDQNELIHFDQDQVIPYTNVEQVLQSVDSHDIGMCYTTRISQMLKIESLAKDMGLSPICIWSTANKEHQMTEEQLSVRESVLKDYKIPEAYNLLIINSSSETSIKIKSHIDYVIVNSTNQDTQIQVRGRVNSDLHNLFLLNDGSEPIDLPEELIGIELFAEGKNRVCDYVNIKNPYRKKYKWPTVKELLFASGYEIREGRRDNLRYAVITLPTA